MRFLSFAAIAFVAALTACQPSSLGATPTIAPTPTVQTTSAPEFEADGSVEFERSGVHVSLPRPAGWESFDTEHGVVIAEQFGTVADRGTLHGLQAYVFVTPLADYPLPADDENLAAYVLEHVTDVPDSKVRVSAVASFTWAGYEAAYYLASEPGAGMHTIVIAVALPDWGSLLTCALSGTAQSARRIRQMLPVLFGGLRLNTEPLSAADLYMLPETLHFPE